jgi:hypothetical protein
MSRFARMFKHGKKQPGSVGIADRPGYQTDLQPRFSALELTRQLPYPSAPGESVADARVRVRQLVEALPFVDAGTAPAIDRIILAWLGEWLELLTAQRAAHREVIGTLRGQAATDVAAARMHVAETTWRLELARLDHARAYYLLTGDQVPVPPPPFTDPAFPASEPTADGTPIKYSDDKPRAADGHRQSALPFDGVDLLLPPMNGHGLVAP